MLKGRNKKSTTVGYQLQTGKFRLESVKFIALPF